MSVAAYPLQWPAGRKRTESWRREASNFKVTIGTARDELFAEIGRLGARSIVLSTNIPLRLDGKPYANTPRLEDPGVAAYFEHKGRAMCFACDRWLKVEDNMRAVAKTIDALRGIARWGTGDMLEAAFTGFTALPAPSAARDWWQVLGVARDAPLDERRAAFRRLASEHHPDKGGDPARMAEINDAWAKAQEPQQ
jgi:hypothetical protein